MNVCPMHLRLHVRAATLLFAATLFAAIAATSGSVAAQEQRVITIAQASHSVGQTVTIEGQVAQVSHSGKSNTTFLNFGARYPNQTFAAVIFASAADRFPNPAQWEGRNVRVTGRVRLYQGRPEIVLDVPSQLVAAP